jgi:hypothetical protein
MAEPTLQEIIRRLEAVEKQLAEQAVAKPGRKKDWRRVVGMFTGSEFMKDVDAEGAAIREAERVTAREGQTE